MEFEYKQTEREPYLSDWTLGIGRQLGCVGEANCALVAEDLPSSSEPSTLTSRLLRL